MIQLARRDSGAAEQGPRKYENAPNAGGSCTEGLQHAGRTLFVDREHHER